MRDTPDTDTTSAPTALSQQAPTVGRAAQWMERTASGLIIEWNGIPPAVVVPTEPGRDAVLEWAFAR